MRMSILIPTYQRPEDITRCLGAIAQQQRAVDELVVVVRDGDQMSRIALAPWTNRLPLRIVEVTAPGVVHALNQGFNSCTGDIVTITDDDSASHPDWLARIERHFRDDPKLGGLGGRDRIAEDDKFLEPKCAEVGRLHFYGRMTGNHHLGVGSARVIDHVKGVNMSWRRAAVGVLRFDESLRGIGAQVYFELAFSLAIKRAGWRIKYDPAVVVDHFPARRYGSDQRGKVHMEAVANTSYNYYWSLTHYLGGSRRCAALAWENVIGAPNRPGWLRVVLARLRGDQLTPEVHAVARRARTAAAKAHQCASRREKA